jgi:hypothetical protein
MEKEENSFRAETKKMKKFSHTRTNNSSKKKK